MATGFDFLNTCFLWYNNMIQHSANGPVPRMIVTGASPAFEASLLALLGSLRVNWPDHPPVLVYDLGMGRTTLDRLASASINVQKVPVFCLHWRKHFTWKIWCIHDAPARTYLWLDAGVCVLRPFPEVFECAEKLGYFCSTNHFSQSKQTSERMAQALGVGAVSLDGMVSINAGIHALMKDERGCALLDEALTIALEETAMRPTDVWHRHDQPLITGLLYKYFGELVLADFETYAGWQGPDKVLNQKIWVHRRRMLAKDLDYFCQGLMQPMPPYIPVRPPALKSPNLLMKTRICVAKWRGRYPKNKAGECIVNGELY